MDRLQLYKCPRTNCFYNARTLTLLISHLKKHGNEPNFSIRCGIENCGIVYKKPESFRKHCYRKHLIILKGEEQVEESTSSGTLVDKNDLKVEIQYLLNNCPNQLYSVRFGVFDTVEYCVGNFFINSIENFKITSFFEIKYIFSLQNELLLCGIIHKLPIFVKKFHSYEIPVLPEGEYTWKRLKAGKELNYQMLNKYLVGGKYYVPLKFGVF